MQTVTAAAKNVGEKTLDANVSLTQIVELQRAANRPSGRRFGALVHAVLASVPLECDVSAIRGLAMIHGRILGAPAEEIDAAIQAASAAIAHEMFDRARQSVRCRRETPIAWRDPDGSLIEGVIDLAFEEGNGWTVIDFKTDEEFRPNETAYQRQLGMYASAIQAATGARVTALLMHV